MSLRLLLVLVVLCVPQLVYAALAADTIRALVSSDSDVRIAAVQKITIDAEVAALPLLRALKDSQVKFTAAQVLILDATGTGAVDAETGKSVASVPADAQDPVNNNRMRRELEAAIAGLSLVSKDLSVRLAAAKALQNDADEDRLPLIAKALKSETDPQVNGLLSSIKSSIELSSADVATRLNAAKALSESSNPNAKLLISGRLKREGANWVEPDEAVRAQLQRSLQAIDGRLVWGERIGAAFSGISLGSVLLLAALGLAITYGLMGVINMAHGELMMIGAYATYFVQNVFKHYLPQAFDAYLLAAIPVSFLIAALVGVVMERTVIRWLYGRPLETLLATWGVSLILMQSVRTLFGAQNVAVENPSWMSGGLQVLSNLILPYNRIAIIAFAALVLLAMAAILARTRLGLFVRAVTQNRTMASCVGVPTARVDTLAFGLGSGVAGLAGCALSQIGNVGPDLGQSYVVDSFMVVVLGGVGQLIGTVYAALGLGVINKFLEGMAGAVLAKIAVLVFIIIFIQKRPQGIFALKGRSADN
jgi:urea transport system permease protein